MTLFQKDLPKAMHKDQKFEQKFEVTEQIYESFMNIFADRNPLHFSEEFAKSKGFKSRVMHGNILNGFISYFIGECLEAKNVIIHSQEIKYSKPVYLGDKLVLSVQVDNIIESVRVVQFSFSFKNSMIETVAKGKIQIGVLT